MRVDDDAAYRPKTDQDISSVLREEHAGLCVLDIKRMAHRDGVLELPMPLDYSVRDDTHQETLNLALRSLPEH